MERIIKELVDNQRTYFNTGATLDLDFRIKQLNKLKEAILDYEEELEDALYDDLNRSKMEAYLCDIGPSIMEINEIIANLRKWAKPELHYSGLMCFPSLFTRVYKMPYGVTLVISPFNFPVYLTIGVLAYSLAGGNTAIIKTSSKSKSTTSVLKRMFDEYFDSKYIVLVEGGHDVADICLSQRFDKIFYTGSPKVGKHVLKMASDNLTPVALELGGETGNWAIVRKDADLKDAARKIAFFKSLNSGQICININQIAVAEEVALDFIEELKKAFKNQIGNDPLNNLDYPKLIDEKAYDKCIKEASLYKDRIVYGGNGDKDKLKFEPTIIYPVNNDEEIVMHELFNPLLPIVPFKDDEVDSIIEIIKQREHPLALYLFTKDHKWSNSIMKSLQYGGGCINEVCIHMMVKGVPFNGTGHSGMGAYHGVWGFREFTHPESVLKGYTHFNMDLREQPYNQKKFNLLKKFEK